VCDSGLKDLLEKSGVSEQELNFMKDDIELEWTEQVVMEMVEYRTVRWGRGVLYGWTTPSLPGFMVLQTGDRWFALTGSTERGRLLVARVEEALAAVLKVEDGRDEMVERLDFFTYSMPKHLFCAAGVKVLELCAFFARVFSDPLAQLGMNTGEGETLESSDSELSE
jgi:hypothetical protein